MKTNVKVVGNMFVQKESFFREEFDFKIFENNVTPFEAYDVENLIGYAAYESMFSLLKPYIKEK